MNSWTISDKGIVRRINQDAYYTFCDDAKKLAILIVCDGMGGAAGGETASRLAVETASEYIREGLNEDSYTEEGLTGLLLGASEKANRAVFSESLKRPSLKGMGTTLVAALVTEELTAVLNIGDSRAYLISDGAIKQITRDHSVVEDMIKRGELDRVSARVHPKKNLITRAVGTDINVNGDIFLPDVKEGDILLLCTDGLSNQLEDSELKDDALSSDDLETCCESLLRKTLARGAPDNITVTLFRK
ncbi:MAG: Stp1/IreP family PP2C-type Ser/Thr phosphatase [Oscillospiraceae bacterium]|nr:Stp1/IreP family PP2C-type Ser/Thr phosphatase [Oscillospiraceae bacterium]